MSERLFRLILAGVMFGVLFLPLNPSPEVMPNWLFIFWYSMEALLQIFGGTDIANRIGWLCLLLFLLAVPLLILLNVCLSVRPFAGLKVLYRILVSALFLVSWYESFHIDPVYRGLGFWTLIAVVSAAVLVEIVFLVSARLGKSGNGGS